MILKLRKERRLGVKRLRNELRRLHGLTIAATTIHKVLVRHGRSALPMRRRGRQEFWATVDPTADGIADKLAVWVHHYNWDRAHEALGGSAPIDRVCERSDKTPLWAEVSDAYEAAHESIRVRDYPVDNALRKLKGCL